MEQRFTLRPVYGDSFVGRKEMLGELLREASDPGSSIGFCLHGRRRIGKTSILKEFEYELSKKKGIVVAYLSFYDLADLSLKTFLGQLSSIILEAFRRKGVIPLEYTIGVLMDSPREVVDSALSKIKLSAGLSEELRFFLEFKKNPEDHTEAVRRAFDLGEKLARSAGVKFILILDEFPEILKVENGLQIVKMFRTMHENHQNTLIVISGSEKKTLEIVALGAASPFYKQLVPKKVLPFSFEETAEFLKRYGLKLPEESIKKLYELTEGVPFYLQFIGRSVSITRDIDAAVKEFISQEGNLFFSEEFERLSEKEGVIARAMAKGAKTPTGISKGSGEPVTSVSSYLTGLQEKGVVKKVEKATYVLADSLFSLWLKERYS